MGSAKLTVKELDSRMSDLSRHFQSELTKFRGEIEKVKTPEVAADGEENRLETFRHRLDFFEATVKNELKCLQSQINELKTANEKMSFKLDGVTQYNCRNNLLLHGVKETRDEDLYAQARNLLQDKLNIKIDKHEIDSCYRYGKKHDLNNRSRPILIKFLNGWRRNEVFHGKRQFKGTNIMCTEHLSPLRYNLFKEIKKRFGRDCWTKDCKVGFVYNGSTHYVATRDQMTAILGSLE